MSEPPGGEYIPLLSAPLGSPLRLVVAGKAVGVLTHYIDGRSMPCIGSQFACEWCNGQRPRWKGYAPCRQTTGKKCVLEVTTGMARRLPLILEPEISGRMVEVWRKGPRRNSPAMIALVPYREGVRGLASFDVRPVLWRMWDLPHPDSQ